MRTGLLAGLGLGLAALALATGSSSDTDAPEGPAGMSRKLVMWTMVESVVELTPTQRYFLMLVAKGEGNYNPKAHNGSDSERAASLDAANANPTIVNRAIACGVPYAHLVSGSWTTFQFLAPYVSGTAHEVFGSAFCPFADPERAQFDLALQIVLAIEHARDLQGYDGWKDKPTVGNLRLGWGYPGSMGKDNADTRERLERYRRVAADERFPAGIVDAVITRFPTNPAQIYAELRERFG